MTQVIAAVLLGLFRSWEFIFVTLAIMVLLPIVFSVASMDSSSRKRRRNRGRKAMGGVPPVQEMTGRPPAEPDEDYDDETP